KFMRPHNVVGAPVRRRIPSDVLHERGLLRLDVLALRNCRLTRLLITLLYVLVAEPQACLLMDDCDA
ncbi:MAG: hypothetical protein ACU84Q_21345, partial [Gammaproteobacteria bacterium]